MSSACESSVSLVSSRRCAPCGYISFMTLFNMTHPPLILITNDDGITSKGLRCAAEACDPLGEVLVCAPTVQQSGTGRSMPPTSEGRIFPRDIVINRHALTAYA